MKWKAWKGGKISLLKEFENQKPGQPNCPVCKKPGDDNLKCRPTKAKPLNQVNRTLHCPFLESRCPFAETAEAFLAMNATQCISLASYCRPAYCTDLARSGTLAWQRRDGLGRLERGDRKWKYGAGVFAGALFNGHNDRKPKIRDEVFFNLVVLVMAGAIEFCLLSAQFSFGISVALWRTPCCLKLLSREMQLVIGIRWKHEV